MKLEVSIGARLGAFALDAQFTAEGGVTALFGRSGSGKTSVLNAISGLLRPARGRIALDGMPLYDAQAGIDLPAHRRRVGYVFQEGRLLPHLSVRQNLLYGRRFAGRSGEGELGHVVSLLGLGALLERRPQDLSGGEKQRVAIGRALLAEPRLLLMDEPLAALDAPRKSEILYYVERLRDDLRVPIVYVSHALDEVVRLADTLVVMSEGRVLESGAVGETMARMELRPFLGRFEGGAVIEARVAEHDLEMGLARLEFAGGTLYAPDVDALVGERLRVRIRARDVSLALARPESISMLNVLAGKVAALGEASGASVDVQLDVAGTALIARVTRKSAAALRLAPGLPVYALIKSVAIDRHSVGWA
ncbi:MAG TPA: molybdenum ABC transporter ATP-binding protein [Burkholderiales bacterium]|nr:molybdenum ABC transporter ATP-binding protein [Burkholderiales bacterium]